MCFSVPCEEYKVNPVLARALDRIFILHADHEQNASTSTVRLAGSSGANPFACIAAGIACLWGPAHGGANEAALKMLGEIGTVDNIPKYIAKAKDKNDPFRLMGFGHRVYKNYDPRAKIMQKTAHEVLNELGVKDDPLLEVAMELERIALHDDYFIEKKLYPNIDFYSGITLKAMGFPVSMFTVLFAVARTVGWIAQWKEMIDDPEQKIGRPRQLYTGVAAARIQADRQPLRAIGAFARSGSPRKRPAVAKESPARTVVGEIDGPEHARGAFGDRPSSGAAHVGGDPARADCVDENAAALEFGGKHAGKGVQRRLRRRIGRRSGPHRGERPGAGGNIDDPAPPGFTHGRREGLRHTPRPEQIDLERFADDAPVGVERMLPRVVMHARVVDERVDWADLTSQPHRRVRVGEIERDRAHVAAEALRRRLPLRKIARAEQHPPAAAHELAADLEPDAAIGAGDKRRA